MAISNFLWDEFATRVPRIKSNIPSPFSWQLYRLHDGVNLYFWIWGTVRIFEFHDSRLWLMNNIKTDKSFIVIKSTLPHFSHPQQISVGLPDILFGAFVKIGLVEGRRIYFAVWWHFYFHFHSVLCLNIVSMGNYHLSITMNIVMSIVMYIVMYIVMCTHVYYQ